MDADDDVPVVIPDPLPLERDAVNGHANAVTDVRRMIEECAGVIEIDLARLQAVRLRQLAHLPPHPELRP